jgi:DNA-binding transcriptional ArsR family regulator
MKPLYHPSAQDITVEGVLYALSDPLRARIFVAIAKSECPKICSAFLDLGERPMPKSTLSQHFKILREAGLIRSERKGVELHNVTRCDELKERFGSLVGNIIESYSQQQRRSKSKKR